MPTWIALLRAVNLGKHNKLGMPDLRAALADAGFADVRTYLQSGNVVCTSRLRSEPKVSTEISGLIRQRFGLDVPVAVRTVDQLTACIEAMPFRAQADQMPSRTLVTFLDTEPTAEQARAFNAADHAPDAARVIGRACYSVHPNGVHKSRLTPLRLHRALGTVGTARNWRTVHALVELAAGPPRRAGRGGDAVR